MGRSYSLDLCERVLGFVASGHSRRAAARHFGVSNSFAIKLVQRVERRGTAVNTDPKLTPQVALTVA
ncbi:hypothetical protein [Devosia sp. A449]